MYNPLNGFALPNAPSEDLNQEEIGEPILEVVLEVGDVLYVPKGIIHQALAQNEDSVHLTISTYQRWTWGDLMHNVLEETILVNLVMVSQWAKGQNVCLGDLRASLLAVVYERRTADGVLIECWAVCRECQWSAVGSH